MLEFLSCSPIVNSVRNKPIVDTAKVLSSLPNFRLNFRVVLWRLASMCSRLRETRPYGRCHYHAPASKVNDAQESREAIRRVRSAFEENGKVSAISRVARRDFRHPNSFEQVRKFRRNPT